MSKFTKLVKHPIRYFKDLKILNGINKFSEMKSYNNMFIVSNLSQLSIINNIIKYEKLSNNILVILYTNKNLKMPKLMLEEAKNNFFDEIVLLLLPNSPINLKLKNYLIMQKDYIKLINNYNPSYVYLLSFEAYYSLLANIAKNYNAKLILIDEGSGTYKDKKNIKISLLKNMVWSGLKLNSAFDWANNFDKIYALFPEYLKENFICNEFIKFSPHINKFGVYDKTISFVNKYGLTENDIIYTNQRYTVEANDFVDNIISILDAISKKLDSKVFIKMHPKDRDETIQLFKEKLASFKNLVLISENAFMMEQVIAYVRPKAVFSLTSTTLISTCLASGHTKVYSIADWLCELIPKTKYNLIGIKQIQEHKAILYKFKHINFIKDENFDFKFVNKTMKMIDGKLCKIYKNNFKNAYQSHKYYNAIINFQLAYDNVLFASFDEIVIFLECLNREYGIGSLNVFSNIFISSIAKVNGSNIILQSKYKILKKLFKIALEHIQLGDIEQSFILLDNIFAIFTLHHNKLEICKQDYVFMLLKSEFQDLYDDLMEFYIISEKKLIDIYNEKKYAQFCYILKINPILKNKITIDKYISALYNTEQYVEISKIAENLEINDKNIWNILNTYIKLGYIDMAKNLLDNYAINTIDFEKLTTISNVYEVAKDYKKSLEYLDKSVLYNPSKLTSKVRLRKFHLQQFLKFDLCIK
ncbi:alpha-2,8-polysialyltransferase [Campylobacter iguaniorum]|uniref:alpha-2,8-polysialyltransferase family protein n=1 Tax=Campylobacter iguaniorum TaxID=1244531 RepID=UPI0007C8B244|nr:alpha-2,8-polysialyltransferase family protein [Campylobacter iguaniorum]ANE35936.1 alpha-2,8-polysialyltransferase [Campylobacter iguaniorum]